MIKAQRYFPFILSAVFAAVLFGIVLLQESEKADFPHTDQATTTSESGKININTADVEELCVLPGIGEALAGQIVAYREEHGDFTAISQITNVSGIGSDCFSRIRDYITVGG